MSDKNFLYAVAVVRANEANLLKEADLEQLINAPDYKKAISILTDKGYSEPQGTDYSAMLDRELEKVWEFVTKNAPDADGLNTLAVKNDIQNLKAVLKAEVMGENAREFLVKPSIIEPDELLEKVSERRFEELPEFISEAAEKAYNTITKTGNGQMCDIIVDEAALRAISDFAEKSDEPLLKEYAEAFCLSTDIKTAYRCMKTKKGRDFIKAALFGGSGIDESALADAAAEGGEAFFDYLKSNNLSDYASALEKGASVFEKFCDDRLISIMKKAKMTAFGLSPVSAYYIAKETEIKCLRIILSAKLSEASNDIIRERMRELYV